MRDVIEWLNSHAGWTWENERFDDATECHDLIEIHEDYVVVQDGHSPWTESRMISTGKQFRWLRQQNPGWADLTWTPDQPPEGGRRA